MNEACVGLISLNNIGWSFIHVVANNRTLAFLLIDNIPISLYNIFIIHVSGDDHHGELLLDNHRCAFVCWYNCFDKYRLACICCYRSFISLADNLCFVNTAKIQRNGLHNEYLLVGRLHIWSYCRDYSWTFDFLSHRDTVATVIWSFQPNGPAFLPLQYPPNLPFLKNSQGP